MVPTVGVLRAGKKARKMKKHRVGPILELKATDIYLMRLLSSVRSLVQDPRGVVAEHLAAVAAAAFHLVVLLVLPPLGSLFERFPTHGACLQLQLDVVGVKMFDQSL